MSEYGYVKRNYEALLSEIGEYEERLGRKITLVCVTKSGSDGELEALVAAGARDLGENRPGELKRRAELLRSKGFAPRFHEIGNLQRNKLKLVIDEASLIHSVGKYELAEVISRQAVGLGITVPVLIEINSGREENKGGALPEEAEALAEEISRLPNLSLRGVMTMGPVGVETEVLRQAFRETREMFERLSQKGLLGASPILSMGMSESFPLAIEEGATMVRIGRTLFAREQ